MRLLSPFAFTEEVDAGLLQRFIEKKSGDVQSEEGYRAQIAAVLAHDASERLAGIGHETLVVTGDYDRVIPAANSDLLASEIPNARLVVIPGAGHLFFVERPGETLAELRAFLDGPVEPAVGAVSTAAAGIAVRRLTSVAATQSLTVMSPFRGSALDWITRAAPDPGSLKVLWCRHRELPCRRLTWMPFAALNGVLLHYEETGDGPPLLLIAGIPAIASDWLALAEALAGTHRVIAFDNRGSGESDASRPGPYTISRARRRRRRAARRTSEPSRPTCSACRWAA